MTGWTSLPEVLFVGGATARPGRGLALGSERANRATVDSDKFKRMVTHRGNALASQNSPLQGLALMIADFRGLCQC